MSCKICGSSVTNKRGKYCSNACRQRAYRDRKKQQFEARKNTLSMDDFLIVSMIDGVKSGFVEHIAEFCSMYNMSTVSDVISLCGWLVLPENEG